MQTHFGASLNVSLWSAHKMNAETLNQLGTLSEAKSLAGFEAINDKKDPLSVTMTINENNGYSAQISSSNNGSRQVATSNDSPRPTLLAFIDSVLEAATAFAATLMTTEERKVKREGVVRDVLNAVSLPLQQGDYALVTPTQSHAAGGSFGMHGGRYTQSATVRLGSETFTIERSVKKHGGEEFEFKSSKGAKLSIEYSKEGTRQFSVEGAPETDGRCQVINIAEESRYGDQATQVNVSAQIRRVKQAIEQLKNAGVFFEPPGL